LNATEEHFIFPLGTVLFPDGMLPLKIFEQRYIEMTKTCLRDSRPFGVCLIKEGREVGEPAIPEKVGCLASIERWEMPQLGVFHLVARGGDRFRLHDTHAAKNGLLSGSISRMPADGSNDAMDSACRDILKLIVDRVGESHFPAPLQLDEPSWVSYRLSEILPLDVRVKQELLEIESTTSRFERLREVLIKEGLISPDA
jgi:uncharacterized protein